MQSLEEDLSQDTQDCERSLIKGLQNYKKDSSSISNYLKRIKDICDKLAAIKKPVFDDDKLLAIGLGPKYKNFVDSQLSKPPSDTFSQIIYALNNNEL